MIDHADFIPALLARLTSCAPLCGAEVKTYKGDRSIAVICTDRDVYLVRERGFVRADYTDLDATALKKLLRTLDKREFPRSNKLHLSALDERPSAHALITAAFSCRYSDYDALCRLLDTHSAVIVQTDFKESACVTARLGQPQYEQLCGLPWLDTTAIP